MFRILTILAAVAALAVSAAPVSAGTPEAAKGACNVPGFMDYTDDSCMAKPRWGSAPASAVASHTRPFNDGLAVAPHSGEVVSDFAKSKPKPAGVYDHGLTQAFTSHTGPHPDGPLRRKNRMSIGMSMGKPMVEW